VVAVRGRQANAKESGWEPVDAYEELLTYFGGHRVRVYGVKIERSAWGGSGAAARVVSFG